MTKNTPFFKFLKKNWGLILLIVILIFGFILRAYHVNYPVVGYHNWKEVHYLSEARNFARDGFFKHGFFVPEHDYPNIIENADGAHGDTFPVISIFVSFGFMVFGEHLWVARGINILFSMLTIFGVYLFLKKLSNKEEIALIGAFLTALSPLFVFFSHNTQLMNPGIAFMVFSAYFFLKWREKLESKFLLWTSLFLALAILTKYPYAIIAVTYFFIFPFKKIKDIFRKTSKLQIILAVLFLLTVPAWMLYTNAGIQLDPNQVSGTFTSGSMINIGTLFTQSFWTPFKTYLKDNYTFLGIYIALAGVIFAFIMKKSEQKRFLIGSIVSILIFIIIMSDKLKGHSYHQFPIAFFIICLMTYAIYHTGRIISSSVKTKIPKKYVFLIPILILLILLIPPSLEARDRQFNTQFFGLDIAGEYIKTRSTDPTETIINSGHQDYGVLWHADRKGVKGVINYDNLTNLQKAEDERNAQWIFMYQWGFEFMQKPTVWTYVQQNYRPVQIAFTVQGDKINIMYILLRKGGQYDETDMNTKLQNAPKIQKNYELSSGDVTIWYANLE